MAHTEDSAEHPLTLWHKNHGNLLALLVVIIIAIGSLILAYEQNRFVPPRFPPERAINNPDSVVDPGMTSDPSGQQSVPAENSGAAAPDTQASATTALIRVRGAANQQGRLAIAVYDNVASFNNPSRAIATAFRPISNGVAEWQLPASGLPERVAIAAYHDEDGNGKLDRNAFGIPTERYGYTNGARGLTGPPHFHEAVVRGPFIGKAIEIQIR